ncbi:MAG: bifunctional diguanylate cyclase/phosphodiesterase [Helicobacteraceae bacterium]|jgi:diguanylate cyclase (GGDEF)-like protein|nr:bifunctional diguanylate cyclase/phosphodiesterase [Helicobacteraceae bacterium]
MQHLILRYESPEELERQIQKHYVHISSNVFVAIYASDSGSIYAQANTIEALLPNAVIIGICAESAIFDKSCIGNEVVLSITCFERARICAFECDGLEFADRTAAEVDALDAAFVVVFGAGRESEHKIFANAFSRLKGSALSVFAENALLISGGRVMETFAVGVAFINAELATTHQAEAKFLPIGDLLTIDAVKDGKIATIDGCEPAEMIARYFGKTPLCLDGFALLKESDNSVAALLNDFNVIGQIDSGEKARVGISPILFADDKCGEAQWQFLSAQSPAAPIARAGCRADSVMLARNGYALKLDNAAVSLREGAQQTVCVYERPSIGMLNALMRYIASIGSIRREQTRCAITPMPSAAASRYDNLTGLPGRSLFFERLTVLSAPAVGLLNVDRFRDINNIYGFEVGDRLLVELSNLITGALKDDMQLFRIGGDLFIALADGYLEESFEEIISSLQTLISETVFLEETLNASNVRVSAGIAFGKEQILSRAESALRKAKKRHVPMIVARDNDDRAKNNLKMLETIRQATIQPWWVLAYYQPIARASDGKIVKYEALIRLRDSRGTVHPPAAFLTLAKLSRYYSELTRIMIRISLDRFKARDEAVAINLSPEDLQNAETMSYLKAKIAEFSEPARVTLELTESEMIDDYKLAASAIAEMKTWGVQIAIDDFGSGYSNFAYLIELQADYLKIDGSIVQKIDKNEKAYQTLFAIVDFAKRLNIKTVAEFISSEAIANKAREAGVDYFQGYHIGIPVQL